MHRFYHFMMMEYKKGKHLITPYLQSKNDLIRSNANVTYIALTNLSEENLIYTPERISKLNVIKLWILFTIRKKSIQKV